jgi:predicted dienelactone hydrolase
MKRRVFLKTISFAAAPLWTDAIHGATHGDSGAGPAIAAVDVLDWNWIDVSRQRPVPARMYLPAGLTEAAPAPLVLFSHGIGGSRFGYAHIGRHLASAGFASLHLQHAGSDRALWLSGAPWALVNRLHQAAQEHEAIARVYDLRFALDQVFSQRIGTLLDSQRVAAAGHSYGANTVLLAAGAHVVREGRVLALAEPRIRAVVAISTPAFYGEPSLENLLRPIRVPSLHISSTDDVIRIPGYVSGPEDRVAAFEAIGSAQKVLALFNGGSHRVFTDRRGIGDWALDTQIKAASRELVTAFLARVFENEMNQLQNWTTDHSVLISQFKQQGLT